MSVSTAMTVIVLNLHHKRGTGRRVPLWARKIVLNFADRLGLIRYRYQDKNVFVSQIPSFVKQEKGSQHRQLGSNTFEAKESTPSTAADFEGTPSYPKQFQHAFPSPTISQNDAQLADLKHEWILLAFVVDRICLFVFMILFILMTVVILNNHPRPLSPLTKHRGSVVST